MKILLFLSYLFFGWPTFLERNLHVPCELQEKISEEQKIEKLIAYIENNNVKFIRNGSEYSPKQAAEHLRMKRRKAGSKIKTAEDFIDHIASKSYVSGEPYQMKFSNGSVINTRDILYHELKMIEK